MFKQIAEHEQRLNEHTEKIDLIYGHIVEKKLSFYDKNILFFKKSVLSLSQ